MQLNDFQKSKVRFHLGYNSGAQIPAGDRSVWKKLCRLFLTTTYDQIVYQINAVKWHGSSSVLYRLSAPKGFSRLEEIAGDVSRTIRTTDPLKADG